MQLDWMDLVYAVAGPLFVFGFTFLLDRRRAGGSWFWSQRELRAVGSATLALFIGPIAAGVAGAVAGSVSGLPIWPSALRPLLLSYALSVAFAIRGVYSGRRPPQIPPDVNRFLAAWESQGLGKPPLVEVVRTPPMVRLLFPDSTHFGPEALLSLNRLQRELSGSYSLVAWSGDRRAFPDA